MGLFGSKKRKKSFVEQGLDAYLKHAQSKYKELSKESAKVNVGPKRRMGEVQTLGEAFPLGVKGQQEVITEYPNKSMTCYWFSTPESRDTLISHLGIANDLIVKARELSGMDIAFIKQVQFAVTPLDEEGYSVWGFTRADWSPVTASGNPSATPVKAYVETYPYTCPGSHGAIIHYGKDGQIKKMVIKFYASQKELTQINVSAKKGELYIKSITHQDSGNSYVLYEK